MSIEFKLSVKNKMEEVKARILNAPNIIYANNETVNVSRGTWPMKPFKQPMNLKNKWTILYLTDDYSFFENYYSFCQKINNKIQEFREKLINHGKIHKN